MYIGMREREILQALAMYSNGVRAWSLAARTDWAGSGWHISGQLGRLKAGGLVQFDGKKWHLTDAGRAELGEQT